MKACGLHHAYLLGAARSWEGHDGDCTCTLRWIKGDKRGPRPYSMWFNEAGDLRIF